jgi:hypothetical protein
MANLSHITRCGLPGVEWVPFARCNGRCIVTLCSCALAQCNKRQVMQHTTAGWSGLDAYWQVFAVPKFLGAFRSSW